MGEVYCHLDKLLDERGITLSSLAQQVGVTAVNLSVLKNNRAKAVRFSTLAALCEALDWQPGDLFSVRSSSCTKPLFPSASQLSTALSG